MNLDKMRESCRNQFPSSGFFDAFKEWFYNLEEAEQKRYLIQFEYPEDQTVMNEVQGIPHGKFNEFCWFCYDQGLVQAEIIGQYEIDCFNQWESKPDFKECNKCGAEFDYRPTREQRHHQDRCSNCLIKTMDEFKLEPEATLGDISVELQNEYWSRIVDQTMGELSEAGVVKVG